MSSPTCIEDNYNDNQNSERNDDENEEVILFKNNNINYRLLSTSLTAEVVESPEAIGDVIVPTFVEYQSKQFVVIQVCDEAFKNSSIESVTFSKDSKVQTIGNFCFENSTIHKLFIPQSLVKLNKLWVKGVKELNEIEIDENNRYFSNKSNFLIYTQQENKNDISCEILFAPRNFEGQFLIPEEITSIGRFAFSQLQGLLSVKSESSLLKKFRSFGFYNCKNLINVSLKGKTSEILLGGFCFSQSENLLSVEISCKTIVIGKNCFSDCSSLKSINLNVDDRVTLGSYAFERCSSLENIMIFKASSIKIGDECFSDSINLKSATFVASSVILGNDIIKNCPMLSYITIESSDNLTILSNTFRNCNLKFIKLVTSSTLTLNDSCFNSNNVDNIELSFKLIHLGKNCFSQCSSLSMITLQSEEDIQICNEIFTGCKSLKKLLLISKSNILISSKFMNGSQNLGIIEISGRNVFIDSNSFENCQSLSSFSIVNSGEIKFNENIFVDCDKLEIISIQCSNINIYKNQICNYKSLKNIMIESYSQIFLRSNCFDGFDNLENVSLLGENILIEENCFKNCPNLNTVYFPKAGNISFRSNTFVNCKKLNNINLKADSNLVFNDSCFYDSFIEKASFESKSVVFGKSCFEDHLTSKSTIKEIDIKGEKVNIGDSCFKNCSLLKSFTISSAKNIEIGSNAFEKCISIENLTINVEEKLKIFNNCFSKSLNLKSFSVLSGKNIEIGIGTFEDCSKLEAVSLKAENQIVLFDYCFAKAENLKIFDFSCNEAVFKENCFYGCLSLKNFTSKDTDKIIFSNQTFNCCDNLENVEIIAQSQFQAGNYCFDRLLNLKKVIVNSQKIIIGDFCFNSCTSLTDISFPNAKEITYYDSYLFDCSGVNVLINSSAIKKEIKSEKLEINKPFITHS